MQNIKIIYAEPPNLTVFTLRPHETTYILKHEQTAMRQQNQLFDSNQGKINTDNVDEWIRINTKNNYNLSNIIDLSYAFRSGYDNAYGIEDIRQVAHDVFFIVKHALFHNGYAAKYADIFDIESIPLSKLKTTIREDINEDTPTDRISRYVNACMHNELRETAEVLEKILERMNSGTSVSMPDSTSYDNEILHTVSNKINKSFKKHLNNGRPKNSLTR